MAWLKTHRPVLDPRAEFFEISASNVILRHDKVLLQFRGRGVAPLLLALDGSTTVALLGSVHGTSRIESVLDRLQRSDLLVSVERNKSAAPVNLLLQVTHPEPGEQLCVVVSESYFRPELREAVQAAQGRGVPWLVLKFGISKVWLSPVFEELASPCWNCFLRRLASQDDLWSLLAKCVYRPRVSTMDLAREATTQIVSHIQDHVGRESRGGVLLDVDIATGSARTHAVIPYPDCACFARRKQSSRKSCAAPNGLWETVVARAGELIDATTGIVTEFGLPSSSTHAPVHVAVTRYADPSMGKLSEFTLEESTGRIVRRGAVSRNAFGSAECSSGARARAILEAFERYCGIHQPGDASLRASFRELGDDALHPNWLMNYSAEQLDHPNLMAETPRELRVPVRFEEDANIHWTAVESLSGHIRYVPTAFCFDGFDILPDADFCTVDSNGSAVAFIIDDAIVRGFLELVERDATAIWWYNRIVRPVVQLSTFDDSFMDQMAAQHAAHDRNLIVFDITHDLGIPVFAAVSWHADGPVFGFGAHFDSQRALRAALREVSQTLCFTQQESRKWAGVDWAQQWHLHAHEIRGENHRNTSDYPHDEEQPTVQKCADAAAALGLEIFVKNCSRAEIDLPVVRVMVPRLRHVWPRFGPGRLYDVPVKLGWLQRPKQPCELNPAFLRS